jgi:hypothetical protein
MPPLPGRYGDNVVSATSFSYYGKTEKESKQQQQHQ